MLAIHNLVHLAKMEISNEKNRGLAELCPEKEGDCKKTS